ncbi:MAG: pentapeptide repeat-containing protein [Geminicoccaceae bacterium]
MHTELEMRSWQHGAAMLFLLEAVMAVSPAHAFDTGDMKSFQANGYTSCQECDLSIANLSGKDMPKADLRSANLTGANLQEANLSEANLQNANLSDARLQKANLWKASLQDAEMPNAKLQGANLSNAILKDANLRRASLQGANLVEANVDNAELSYAKFAKTTYAPKSLPPAAYLVGIEGLDLVVILNFSDTIGLVQLRRLLQEGGLPEERQATYAIEHNKTDHLLYGEQDSQDRPNGMGHQLWDNPFSLLEGAFRWFAFELPVGYGLYPGRALLVLIGAVGIFALIYTVALAMEVGSIYRVWPAGRLEPMDGALLAASARAEPLLLCRSWTALGRGLQFSFLSAFDIGFRELTVGNWLARLQTHEYELRAVGWVRAVAGVQSLLSVYLVAMWALTYFGRPFG